MMGSAKNVSFSCFYAIFYFLHLRGTSQERQRSHNRRKMAFNEDEMIAIRATSNILGICVGSGFFQNSKFKQVSRLLRWIPSTARCSW